MHLNRFRGELIFFSTEDDLKHTGFLMDIGKEHVVIFVHGMGGSFYKMGFLEGAGFLRENEISFFSINTRGAEIVKDFKDLNGEHHTIGTAFENFEDSIMDIKGAIDTLAKMGFKNFHLMGHSTGCQKILYYAYRSKDGRVKSLHHVSPAEDYEIWKNELGDDFEKFVDIAREMSRRGEGNKLLIPLYEKTGEFWSASRFLSFASRDNWEARMFLYENLEIFSKVKLPTQIFLGKEDPFFLKPLSWYAKKLKDAYHGTKIDIEIMPGDHSFHGYEDALFKKMVEFINLLKK